jgi:hypothetical protein
MASERRMKMEWPQLKMSIEAILEDGLNPELCEEIWKELPFECIQEHGVVTGKIIYCWTPAVSQAPVKALEKHTDAAVGRVSYSQGTGNKIIIKYGECTEDIGAPVLARIDPKDIETLKTVGKIIWDSVYISKDIYHVIFSRKGG